MIAFLIRASAYYPNPNLADEADYRYECSVVHYPPKPRDALRENHRRSSGSHDQFFENDSESELLNLLNKRHLRNEILIPKAKYDWGGSGFFGRLQRLIIVVSQLTVVKSSLHYSDALGAKTSICAPNLESEVIYY